MKFKRLYEDDESADLSQDEGIIYRKKDGTFWYSPDGNISLPLPPDKVAKAKKEYENDLRQKQIEQGADYDPEKHAQEEAERLKKLKHDMEDDSGEIISGIQFDDDNSPGYKLPGGSTTNGPKKKSRYAGVDVDPSLSEVKAEILKMMGNALKPEVKQKPTMKRQWEYAEEDPYEQIAMNDDGVGSSDDVRVASWHYRPSTKPVIKHDTETPFVFFYFDRSGSFHTTSKTGLGNKLVDMFKSLEDDGKVVCRKRYFTTRVSDDPNMNGGTDGDCIVQDLHKLADGHKAHVVLLTDDGCPFSSSYEVNGCVFLVFCDEYDDKVQNHLFAKRKENMKTFFFKHDPDLNS